MEDPLRQAARLILASAYAALSNSMVGNQAPVVRDYYKRVKAPQIGDWVMETSSLFRIFRAAGDPGNPLDQLGVLVKKEDEVFVNEEGMEAIVKGCYIWTIKTLDGREFKWSNANFIAIPDRPGFAEDHLKARAQPDAAASLQAGHYSASGTGAGADQCPPA